MGIRQVKLSLQKDDAYKKFKVVVKHTSTLAPFEDLSKEIETMHSARKSRTLHLKSPNLSRIMDASMQGSSFRSRCVEIQAQVMKAQRLLQAAIKRIEAHISTSYKDQMGVRSQADVSNMLKAILQSAYYQLADYERITEMIKNVIEDIDQAQWSMKHTLDALNILYTRESILGTKKR